jgi:hypothetical protein
LNARFPRDEFDYRSADQLVAAHKTDTSSQQLAHQESLYVLG